MIVRKNDRSSNAASAPVSRSQVFRIFITGHLIAQALADFSDSNYAGALPVLEQYVKDYPEYVNRLILW